MSEPRFQIVFRGKLLAGFELEQVRSNLAKLFRVDEGRIGAMLAQPKWVVKAGLDKAQAQRFQDALREAGMMVAVMNDLPAPASVGAATPPSSANSTSTITPVAPVFTQAPPPIASAASSDEITAATADTPLAIKPQVKAYEPDLSAFSLAPVGALIDQSTAKPQPREYDISNLTVAAPGAQLVEKKPVKTLEIDTSSMRVEAVESIAEKPRSALLREMG